MARPLKQGLDYFPIDVHFFNDRKIKLLKTKHGAKGVYLLSYLYCEIYRDDGYYMEWDEETSILIACDVGCNITSEFVETFINDCCKYKIFDKELFERLNIITSRGIQRRYLWATEKRKSIKINPNYLLIDETEFKNLNDRIEYA